MNDFPVITILTLLPLLGGIAVIGLGGRQILARGIAFTISLASLAIAVWLWLNYDAAVGGYQFVRAHDWIPVMAVRYHVAVDGLGVLMVLLTAIVTPMAMLASWRVSDRAGLYFALMLFLQAGLFGTFTALNFFHWFLFWELGLIPAFFLVRLWGGPQRGPAATQFFVYTMVGSIALLLAFAAVYYATGIFDFVQLGEAAARQEVSGELQRKLGWELFGHAFTARQMVGLVFLGAFLGFAVKVPLIPFHTWLPSAYSEASTGTAMLLTGVMSKMGVYAFIRILLPIFPDQLQAMRTPLLVLAVMTIVLSAFAAFAQRDLKRILAYSSINHLGYCMLAIFAVAVPATETSAADKAAALNGALLQMFNHGITAATLFWFVGLIEQRSGGLRGVNDFGGLRKPAPVLCGLMGIALFSSLGLPGLNGFIGEFLIFRGVFPLAPWAAGLSVLGLLVTAVFILTILQRVFNGPLSEKWRNFPDLTFGERILLGGPILLMFALGLHPQLILGKINSTVMLWIQQLRF